MAGTPSPAPQQAVPQPDDNDQEEDVVDGCNAIARTATYVDDNAQGPMAFVELCKGWGNFLQMCEDNQWVLNATKTQVGYPTVTFFGFECDAEGTRLAEKNLDPITRMVPPKDLHELRQTLRATSLDYDYELRLTTDDFVASSS